MSSNNDNKDTLSNSTNKAQPSDYYRYKGSNVSIPSANNDSNKSTITSSPSTTNSGTTSTTKTSSSPIKPSNNVGSGSSTKSSRPVLHNFTESIYFYPICGLIFVLSLILIIILSKVNLNVDATDESNKIAGEVFLILFIFLLIFILVVALVPNFKDLKKVFQQIGSVSIAIVYTVFIILLYGNLPSDVLNDYSYLIVGATIILGAIVFYKAGSSNYVLAYDLNYERIKSMILFFCLITLTITLYNINPGGIITQNFGSSLIIAILLMVFSFLYMVIILTLGDTKKTSTTSVFKKFSTFGAVGSSLFFLFLLIITIVIVQYPGGFFSEQNMPIAISSIIIILLICILAGMLLISNLFPESHNKSMTINKLDLFKRALLMLFGTLTSIFLVIWLVYNMQNLTGQSSVFSFIINLLLVLSVLGLIGKILFTKSPGGSTGKANAFGELIKNLIFYIPCLFVDIFDLLTGVYNQGKGKSYWEISVFTIILMIVYFVTPYVMNMIRQQGGKVLINQPIYTNVETSFVNFGNWNNNVYDYNYGLSFWLFLDAFPPSTNKLYNDYITILSYAKKPEILYNASKNTLIVKVKYTDLIDKSFTSKDLDSDGNLIIYRNTDMKLQKWNNIIVNYNGGIMDIFINGELKKSVNGVVPYYRDEPLIVGKKNGYIGGICNLVYHSKTLSANNINIIYESLKTKNPPAANYYSTQTVINN
jgi:hypothetical protein